VQTSSRGGGQSSPHLDSSQQRVEMFQTSRGGRSRTLLNSGLRQVGVQSAALRARTWFVALILFYLAVTAFMAWGRFGLESFTSDLTSVSLK